MTESLSSTSLTFFPNFFVHHIVYLNLIDDISGEATSDSVDHQIHVKEEEPEDEDDLCKTAGSIRVQTGAQ